MANLDARAPRVLICIPTYNEKDNLEPIVRAVLDAVGNAHVLVIDDDSPDGTGELADVISRADERVHVLHRSGKQGLGKAYLAAFAWGLAREYELFFEVDADFSHNPRYLPGFIALLVSGEADVVIGSRRVPGGAVENWGPLRRFVSWGGSTYARTVLGMPVRDLTGGFNGFRRGVLEAIGLETVEATGYAFQIELKYRAFKRGFKLVEQPIIFPDRRVGQSKMSSRIFLEAIGMVWKMRWSERGTE
jgi:dolichol-phosphate mannosyltransferase